MCPAGGQPRGPHGDLPAGGQEKPAVGCHDFVDNQVRLQLFAFGQSNRAMTVLT